MFFYTGFLTTTDEELRIVMVGMDGTGKSSTGNTILGQQCFKTKLNVKCSPQCCKEGAVVDGQQVSVINTPDLHRTRFHHRLIHQCVRLAAPGPHVFLVVISLGRFRLMMKEEKQMVQKIKELSGQDADRHCMVPFTHGDRLEDVTIEEFLDESPDLQQLVATCNGQYHVFNNKLKDLKDRSQVTELLHKIRSLVQKNGGSHYTNEMFKEANEGNPREDGRAKMQREKGSDEKRKMNEENQTREEDMKELDPEAGEAEDDSGTLLVGGIKLLGLGSVQPQPEPEVL